MTKSVLELNGISSGYNGREILSDIDLTLSEPSIYVVLGPNGAGKTTLLRTISGILEPLRGSVAFDGVDVHASKEARKRICYLSHHNALPEEMTVYDSLNFYSDIQGGDVEGVIDRLTLKELRAKRVSDLSQGQAKRVSIAKVLLSERDLYLMDESTSNLDPFIAQQIRDTLLELSKRKIVLYSSHNLYEAREIGTYLILVKDGRIGFFDRIENLKLGGYRVGIKASTNISHLVPTVYENGIYVVKVKGPDEVGEILGKLVAEGINVTEVRELDNPLEDLFKR